MKIKNKTSLATGIGLFLLGSLRTIFIKGNLIKNGLEILLVGALAAVVAYGVGYFVEGFLSQL